MKMKWFALVFTVLFISTSFAQSDDVLFTVDGDAVLTSEFKRVYSKNLNLVQDESQKDVDEYLKLFVNYKVKLKEARAQGLHEKPNYQRELSNYKKQLAKNYMSDNTVSEALVKEAYAHFSQDVKANHILVRVSDNATAEDTLAAFNLISEIKTRTETEGFEPVRKEVHDGKKVYGEELGWFTAFRMVYPFEKVAFNTPVGETSEPFRTQFGFHIVHVLDKRKSPGKCTVKHIMVMHKKEEGLADFSENRIKELYQKIQQGEEFETIAKEFSDDKNTAPRGGELQPFSSGQLSVPEFEETAFALENPGDISEPIRTEFGWHIIKLKEIEPIGSFEQLKSELEAKVKRDDRSKLIEEALIAKLKKKRNIGEETPNLEYFASILNDDFFTRKWQLPEDFKADQSFLNIGEKSLTFADFGEYLVKYQRTSRGRKPFEAIAKEAYNAFLSNELKAYEEEHLEAENEDFAHILSEYRDGLLLFDLMENTIWKTAKTDSLEIQKYYDNNKDKYYWPERVVVDVASASKRKIINRVSKMLHEEMSFEHIKKLVNTNGDVHVIITSDTMPADHQALPKDFEFKPGISKVYKHNKGYVVAKVQEVLPKTLKPFEDIKGLVMSDYQTHKESLWLAELKEKYKVEVNADALKKVKAEL
ncbi:peptidylprolyl isomerase [Hyunsoonleella rubra]|uniref:Peptidylprolyl isomerase n=1 Tax=Hyunsoonleella rubra TaxID=1737062 RepID=A0ABW5T991_9FLAO